MYKTVFTPIFIECAEVVVITLGLSVPLSKSAISYPQKALLWFQCIDPVCSRHAGTDVFQENMLTAAYAALFPFQACSSEVKLSEVSHYHALKNESPLTAA